jgi:exodeoxyribonuclease VII large subunit
MSFCPSENRVDALGSEGQPYAVSDLNAITRQVVEGYWPRTVWVLGEASNVACPASGHWYFSLKDAKSQIACVMFRYAQSGSVLPNSGDAVLVCGKVSLYEGRGHFQLLASRIIPDGAGVKAIALARLKKKLSAEGLFDAAHKKPLPVLPRAVGIVSALGAAGLQDMLKVLRLHCPFMRVFVYPATVQGVVAAGSIVKALARAQQHGVCDVLLLGRGGGAAEDLDAFNDEALVRAVHACSLPIVTGIGHETDVSLCDFVADVHAATPTQAAVYVVPEGYDVAALVASCDGMKRDCAHIMRAKHSDWRSLVQRLVFPHALMAQHRLRLDDVFELAGSSIQAVLLDKKNSLSACAGDLVRHGPRVRLGLAREALLALAQALSESLALCLQRFREDLLAQHTQLVSCNPNAVLSRGYAMVSDVEGGLLTSSSAIKAGDVLSIRLLDGSLSVKVEAVLAEAVEQD